MENYELRIEDLKSIAHGACFFACGGGGSLTTTLEIIEDLPKDSSVECVSLDTAKGDDNGITATVAFIGAPDAISESKDSLKNDVIAAFKNLNEKVKSKYSGQEITYLIPIEIGALNILATYIVAAEINKGRKDNEKIKIIDGDGAGRAVPQLTLLTFAANGISCNPTILSRAKNDVDEAMPERIKIPHRTIFTASGSGLQYNPTLVSSDGNYNVSIEIASAADVEELARVVINNSIFNQYAGLAMWPMKLDELVEKAKPVEGSVKKAWRLGNILKKLKDKKIRISCDNKIPIIQNPETDKDETASFFEVCPKEKVKVIFDGKLKDIQTSTSGGFDHGLAIFEKNVKEKTSYFYIYIQNENIIGWESEKDRPEIMAPDLICYLSKDSVTPKGCLEPIRVFTNAKQDWKWFKDKEVMILGVCCDEKLKTGKLKENFQQLRMALGYPGSYIDF